MLFSQKLFNFKRVKIGQILKGYKTCFVRSGHNYDNLQIVDAQQP